MAFSRKQWKTVQVDEALAKDLAGKLDLPVPAAKVLVGRGYGKQDDAERFLNPRLSDLSDPFELPGMIEAVERIWTALTAGQKIAIYGDYDADGVTSTALLVSVLRAMRGQITAFLPNRLSDGYGLTTAALERCVRIHKPQLIITVDCGTCSVEAVEFVRRCGIDIVVTDHHELSGNIAPAFALVNPNLGGNEGTMSLAGVGVAFKLCHALIKWGLNNGKHETQDIDLRNYLYLVAIGTVADIVPLLGENRILVRHGLTRIQQLPDGEKCGLKALIDVAGIKTEIDCYHLGFMIGPRLNAAGRLSNAEPALELLLTDDPDRARQIAVELDAANRERKRVEETIVAEAIEEIDSYFEEGVHFGIVAGRAGWHVGVIGIVASRLCGRYRRPAVVVGFDEQGLGRGSCRSVESVDIVEILRDCSDLLVSFGGHKMAAGLVVDNSRFDTFRKRFNELCAEKLEGVDLEPVRNVDAWINLGEADERLFEAIRKFRPLGLGNPAPTWGVSNVRLVGQPRIVGEDHIKMILASGGTQLEAIGFGMAECEIPEGPIDVLFHLQENTYRGRTMLQLDLKDFRSAVR